MPPNPKAEPSHVNAGDWKPQANKKAVAAKKAAVYIGAIDSPGCNEIVTSARDKMPAKAAGPRQATKIPYQGTDRCVTSASVPTTFRTRIATAARNVLAPAMARAKRGTCEVSGWSS